MPRLPDAPSFEVPRDYAQIDRDEDIYEETWEDFNVNSKDAVLQRIGEVVMDTTRNNVRGGFNAIRVQERDAAEDYRDHNYFTKGDQDGSNSHMAICPVPHIPFVYYFSAGDIQTGR